MRTQEDGTVVNVSSVAGRLSFPGGGVYAGSKWALEAMSDALRGEVEEYGIDVVVVEPGPVETRFSERAASEVDDGPGGVERSGAYGWFYETFEDTQAIGGGGPGAVPPERVAEDILNAASATKPDSRVPVGTLARIAVLGRFLPDAARDKGIELFRKFR
jgi:short-subunit dehydrogenase